MKIVNSDLKIKALARHIRMSPNKVQRVISQIRGRSYEEALMILEFMPYRACNPILQLLASAAANANHNFGLNKTDLFISGIQVDRGRFLKRLQPRAQGRGYPIHKPTSHITIVMEVTSE
uniref:Large ribosomal subunit protein uL22c n=1 Tax=Ptilidium pulcherrimum TaxID=3143427 RepID=F5GV42_9MARC|nr:ribosomal protein L22 [Ptilidium ciliare var. pulcherrimum]ADK89644.1 ribosomal protein L22 [Ptilidium ciliare var. pulcherrimum]